MGNPLNLTNSEKDAKDFFIKIYSAYDIPIDTGRIDDIKQEIPIWFDETKYQRFADPTILDIVYEFLPSSTKAFTKRLIDTVLHVISWSYHELAADSKSWKSLNRIRRIHLAASNTANKKGIGFISQTEVAITLFTFVGFAIVRSHQYGIPNNNKEDRESFIHFWGLMGHFLGLKDEFNFCLCNLEICEIVCEIFIRYVFIPCPQFEPPVFKEIVLYTVDGLQTFLPDLSYDSIMFMVKRVCNIPGYQCGVDVSKENIIKDIFTKDEIKLLQKYVSRSQYAVKNAIRIFPEKIHIVEVVKGRNIFIQPDYDDQELKYEQYVMENYKILGLKKYDKFIIKTIRQEGYQTNLCNTKLRECSSYD